VYNKLGDKDLDVFHVDLVIEEKQNGVIETQPKSDTDFTNTNGDAVLLNNEITDEIDGEDTPVEGARVSQSVDDLTSRQMQVKDMEIDILRGGASSEYIVMDKLDDSRIIKLRTKSIEMNIQQE
jgi:hypothetical protein